MKKILLASLLVLSLTTNVAHSADPATSKPVVEKQKAHKKKAVDSLPKEKAELFKKTEAAQQAKAKEINTKIKATRTELKEILKAETFNKDAYLKKSAEIIKLESEKDNSRAEAVAGLASQFTAEERKALVGAFKNHSRKKSK